MTANRKRIVRFGLLAALTVASSFASGDPTVVASTLYGHFQTVAAALCGMVVMVSLGKLGFTGIRAVGGAIAAGLAVWGVMNSQGVVSWFQSLG